jgi:hypothetical protein
MRKLTKSLIVTSIVGTIGLGGLATAAIAGAESTPTATSSDPMSSLVDKISSTFNIDKTKLQALFTADRTAHEAERKQQVEAKLTSLVTAGTITAAQKTAIETELTKLQSERDADRTAMQSLTDDQRKAKMDERKTELEAWAKAQGIDLTKLDGIFGGRGGPGGPGM